MLKRHYVRTAEGPDGEMDALSLLLLLCATSYPCIVQGGPNDSVSAQLLLRGNITDLCRAERTKVDRQDCYQRLAEVFFIRKAPYFTDICPSFGRFLEMENCAGCPWDMINHSALLANPEPMEVLSHSLLFNPASPSCSAVDIVGNLYEKKYKTGFLWDTLGMILPTLANIFLSASDEMQNPTTFKFVGRHRKN